MKSTLTQRILCSAGILFVMNTTQAQSTYTAVYNLLQAKCASCHGGATPSGSLDLSGTAAAVYANIVNHTPANIAASGRGDKIIKPGYAHSSFLLRKIINGMDADNGLMSSSEGTPCPKGVTTLTPQNIELIRQWIQFAAPQTGNVTDTNMINKYYTGKGITSEPTSAPLPTAPGSYQVHLGKVFLDTASEMEYFQKFDLGLSDTIEVNRIELFMGVHSHHFILYKYLNAAAAASFGEGMRIQNALTGAGSSTGKTTIIGAWQRSYDYALPATTAYQWPTGTILDMNHHFYNFNQDSVLAMDIYFNVYTQPKGTCQNIMYSTLYYNPQIYIPNTGTNIKFTQAVPNANAKNMWNIWFMSSHTHKYGVGFDIYERNADGTTGTQMYSGETAYPSGVPTGYFDWSHPPVELFNPTMYTMNPVNGFVAEATYNNNGPAPVQWGLTTKDEMMVFYIQYTLGAKLATGIQEDLGTQLKMMVYPNPAAGSSSLFYTLGDAAKVRIDVYNLMGQNIRTLANEQQAAGSHQYAIDNLAAGTYVVKTTVNGTSVSRKVVITN
jgi:hypothetical protein